MFKRSISVNDIELVIKDGQIIKNYSNDKPFPSYLIKAFVDNKMLHVVVSGDTFRELLYYNCLSAG